MGGSEEWGQQPEVQSHQLRQLCGANSAERRWGLRVSLQKTPRESERCSDGTPVTKT